MFLEKKNPLTITLFYLHRDINQELVAKMGREVLGCCLFVFCLETHVPTKNPTLRG